MSGKIAFPIKIIILTISSIILIYNIITQSNLATITLPIIPIALMILGWIKEGWDIIDKILGVMQSRNIVQTVRNNRFLSMK